MQQRLDFYYYFFFCITHTFSELVYDDVWYYIYVFFVISHGVMVDDARPPVYKKVTLL